MPYKKDPNSLSYKQKQVADALLADPKLTPAKAVMAHYGVTTTNSASALATRLMKQDKIQAYMSEHAQQAEDTMLEVMRYSKLFGKSGSKEGAAYAGVAVSVAKDVLDRTYGKATQKIENQTTGITLTIDLTSALAPDNGPSALSPEPETQPETEVK